MKRRVLFWSILAAILGGVSLLGTLALAKIRDALDRAH